MSTFCGLVPEFPGISIDNFSNANLQSSIYFLSHIHSDHMNGFSNLDFLDKLSKDGISVYASEVSTKMLQLWYPLYAKNFKSLPIDGASLLELPETKEFVSVMLIPAGHCPGSVMFLFEGNEKTVLYTGDFRINPKDLSSHKCFYDWAGTLKKIDKIYMDTTFFNADFPEFPTREESLEALCACIIEWLEKCPENIVNLQTSSIYGAEFVFLELWKYFAMPIHISERRYEVYKYFPDMDKAITLNGRATRIHACDTIYNRSDSFCQIPFARFIKLSAWHWKQWQNGEIASTQESVNFFRVCYSSHPSLQEAKEFLNFLKPLEVGANVMPQDEDQQQCLLRLIEDTLSKYRKIPNKCKIKCEDNHLFKIKRFKSLDSSVSESFSFIDDSFALLDSPERE